MAGMLEYKCPCCDGAIQFDSATQKMKCPYCDTEFDVDTLKSYDEELKDEKPSEMEWATPGGSWAEGETAGLPVLRQPHRPHRTVCRGPAARPHHPLQTGQKGRQGKAAGAPQGQDPAAPGVPQPEPHR